MLRSRSRGRLQWCNGDHGRLAEPDRVDRAGSLGSLAAFVHAVTDNRGVTPNYENSGADNRRSLAMVLAAIESAQSGRVVQLGA
jgi:predicted dehydrogenase